MKTLLTLVALLGIGLNANACPHLPAQALLQGVTCPTCGVAAQAVQQPVQYIQQQPVQAVQRVVVQQYVQPQLLQQQLIVQPQVYSSAVIGGYSSSAVIVAPQRGINAFIGGGRGVGFSAHFGGGFR